jgi:hypothetical protein
MGVKSLPLLDPLLLVPPLLDPPLLDPPLFDPPLSPLPLLPPLLDPPLFDPPLSPLPLSPLLFSDPLFFPSLSSSPSPAVSARTSTTWPTSTSIVSATVCLNTSIIALLLLKSRADIPWRRTTWFTRILVITSPFGRGSATTLNVRSWPGQVMVQLENPCEGFCIPSALKGKNLSPLRPSLKFVSTSHP